MSSHHVVREKQEPGLLILEPGQFDRENLGQLLEWSPTVLVADTAMAFTDALGIKVDGVITQDPGLPVQAKARRILSQGGPLQTGLDFFIGEGYPALNIIGAEAGDEQYEAYADRITLVIYSGSRKHFPVRPGFSKWKMKGELLEIAHPDRITSLTNLEHVSERSFRVLNDGLCTFSFSGPFIFVTEDF